MTAPLHRRAARSRGAPGTGRRRPAAAAAAVVLAASVLAGCGRGGTYTVVARFDDVGDLHTRGSVQTADVRIGDISEIKLTDDFKARVTLRVKDSIKIPRASEAVLRTTSLLGEKFVELRPRGDPAQGPFLRDGEVLQHTGEAPELEFVADQLVTVLGAVSSTNLATIVETGAVGFGQRGPELRALIGDLSTISATLASRTSQIGAAIDGLDRATQTLAGGANDIKGLLTNLATTTGVLVDNRQQALTALDQLSRLARVQNELLDRYRGDMDRQIKQIDVIVSTAAAQTRELSSLVDFLDRFITGLPVAIPGEFTHIYAWGVPCLQDKRSPAGCP